MAVLSVDEASEVIFRSYEVLKRMRLKIDGKVKLGTETEPGKDRRSTYSEPG